MHAPVKIFVVYAHEDKSVRDKLLRQLRPLADNDEIELWSDHEIKAGELWDEEIQNRLLQSEIILLLISDDFFASDYIRRVEFRTAIDLYNSGKVQILPVIARHCGWADLPALSRLQMLPPEGRPVLSKEWDSPDEPYLKIYEAVKTVVRELRRRKEIIVPASDVPQLTTAPASFLLAKRKWWVPVMGLALLFLFLWIKCPYAVNRISEIPSKGIPLPDSSTLRQTKTSSSTDSNGIREITSDKEKKRLIKSNETPVQSPKPNRDALQNKPVSTVPKPVDYITIDSSDGMTRIIKGKQQSYLNSSGQWIGIWFDDAENFHNGTAYVKSKGRYFWIDKSGKCVKACE